MNFKLDFMTLENPKEIFRTKKDQEVIFSYERVYNDEFVISKNKTEDLFLLKSDFEKVDYYPFIVVGEPVKCFFDEAIKEKVREPHEKDDDLYLMAYPVCFYFENFTGWVYSEPGKWDTKFEKTGAVFPTLKHKAIYKMNVTPIKDELGENHKTELRIPNAVDLFQSEEDLVKCYLEQNSNKDRIKLNDWNSEFMVLNFGKPFTCSNTDFDELKTTNRGGVAVLPVQVIVLEQEKIGWLPITPSRLKYALQPVDMTKTPT